MRHYYTGKKLCELCGKEPKSDMLRIVRVAINKMLMCCLPCRSLPLLVRRQRYDG